MQILKTKAANGIAPFLAFWLSLALISCLTGCSSMNSNFDCPMKPGITCRSLDQVNDMIDRGCLGSAECTSKASNPGLANTANYATSINASATGDQNLRIWVAPYLDTAGNYHHASVIQAPIKTDAAVSVPTEITASA